jgi:peptide chain release factor 1
MYDRLENIANRFEEIEHLLAQPEITANIEHLSKLSKERSELLATVSAYQNLQSAKRALNEASALTSDADPELVELAKQEIETLSTKVSELEETLKRSLVPRDPDSNKNVIMEIRAGTGGDEAALFAADLYRMYFRFAQRKGWRIEIANTSSSAQGGIKEIIFQVSGLGAYGQLKHESGVHRVQRVPATETQGRIHTSTSTVAVLPEAEEVDVQVKQDELRIDIFHAGGAGGQNVNKVATAVRIVHLPSGITAICQDERSQLKNKVKAMTVLRSRLYAIQMREQQEQTVATRRSQVGTGERSEKIRTYNFPQDRLSDHRIGMTMHGLEAILEGDIDHLVTALVEDETSRILGQVTA